MFYNFFKSSNSVSLPIRRSYVNSTVIITQCEDVLFHSEDIFRKFIYFNVSNNTVAKFESDDRPAAAMRRYIEVYARKIRLYSNPSYNVSHVGKILHRRTFSRMLRVSRVLRIQISRLKRACRPPRAATKRGFPRFVARKPLSCCQCVRLRYHAKSGYWADRKSVV